MSENRGPWYLLTGLIIGAALGVLYTWAFRPVEYVDTAPASLKAEYKDQYRALIAAAFLANGDLVRARARLDLLGDTDVYRTLAEQAQRTLAEGSRPEEARALGVLAVGLGQQPAEIPTLTTEAAASPPAITQGPAEVVEASAQPAINTDEAGLPPGLSSTITPLPAWTATSTETQPPEPTSSATLPPPRTPTPTQGAPFVLQAQEKVCDAALAEPQVQVQTLDAEGQPVPGVKVVITWQGGEENFYTGLKPEIGLGYADFTLEPGVDYTLQLAAGGQPITGLTAADCEGQGGQTWGVWRLTFTQP